MQNLFQSLHLELTHKCNLRCLHCYNISYLNSKEEDLSLKQIKKIIDISKNLGCKSFGFSGGEPFARQDIFDIIKYAPGPVHVLTNSLLINDDTIKQIKKIKKPIEFRVSLDGLESHKILRKVDCEKVLNKIRNLRKNGLIVTVNTMVTPYNVKELMKMYDVMKECGVDRWRIDFIFDGGNAALNKLSFNTEDVFKQLRKIIKIYLAERPLFELDINKFFRSVCLKGNISRIYYTPQTRVCGYQKTLTVRPNGDVSFCPSLDIVFGNILKDGIDFIMKNKKWENFSSIELRDIKKCLNCKIFKLCGGGCRADAYYKTNSFYGVDDFTCKAMKYFAKNIFPLINKNNAKI